jgi:hypothetical protein
LRKGHGAGAIYRILTLAMRCVQKGLIEVFSIESGASEATMITWTEYHTDPMSGMGKLHNIVSNENLDIS